MNKCRDSLLASAFKYYPWCCGRCIIYTRAEKCSFLWLGFRLEPKKTGLWLTFWTRTRIQVLPSKTQNSTLDSDWTKHELVASLSDYDVPSHLCNQLKFVSNYFRRYKRPNWIPVFSVGLLAVFLCGRPNFCNSLQKRLLRFTVCFCFLSSIISVLNVNK